MSVIIKRLPTAIMCLFFIGSLHGQPQKKLYTQAFNYIKSQHTDVKIITVDTLANIELNAFFKELGKQWKKNEKLTLLFLDSLERSLTNDSSKPIFLKKLSAEGKQPTKYIYFSNAIKINQMLLEAEIFDSPKGAPIFGHSEKYLFIFDEKNRLKKVFKHILSYN